MSERHAQEALDIALDRLAAERALADDLAATLDRHEPEWGRSEDVINVLARYREARQQ